VQRADRVRVVVQIPDRDVPVTERGAPVDIKFNALPGQRFAAKVSRIGFAEDENTRTMPVEIDVPNPQGLLRPGMFGSVIVHLKKPPTLMIPEQCLTGIGLQVGYNRNEFWVYVVHDGKAHRTKVQMGPGEEGKVEIFGGLKPSDRVVIDPKGLTGDVVPVEVQDAP
jgi:RND family efflux transporter MFP subunit